MHAAVCEAALARPCRRVLGASAAASVVALGLLTGFTPGQAAAAGSELSFGLLGPDPAVPVSLPAPAVSATPGIDAPDPYVIQVGGRSYLFTSQALFFGPNIPIFVSNTFGRWSGPSVDALPTLPSWADPGFTWSPDVRRIGGRYVMWFNANVAGTGFDGIKCLGVATSASVRGPYVSDERRPAVCQRDRLGSIDPRTFVGPDGRLWLLWKSDDNADLNADTHSTIFIQQLSPDGLRVVGAQSALLTANLPWEGRIVESPDMVFAGGHYWLFFSGNWFNQPGYGVGVAECHGPTGPCDPGTAGPWLSSNAQGSGPGEESIYYDGTRWWMLYAPFAVDYEAFTPRPAVLARLAFGPDGPVVVPPGTRRWAGSDPGPDPRLEEVCGTHRVRAACDAWKRRLSDRR